MTTVANIKGYINGNDWGVIYHEPPRGETIYTHEYGTIMHNAELGQIKISADTFDDIIIADKNVGATTVFNYGDTISAANLGNVYQWGNKYAFPYGASSPTVSTSQVNMSSYTIPSTYISSTFINVGTSDTLWTSGSATQGINLRGNTTNTEAARKGPCATGYHVPSNTEVNNLINAMKKIGLRTGNQFSEYLKMPIPGYYRYYNGIYVQYENDRGGYWTSTFNTSAETSQSYVLHIRTTNNTSTSYNLATGYLCPIRPFVNGPVTLKTFTELKAYTDSTALLTELNTYPSDYFTMLKSENHINDFCAGTDTSGFIDDTGDGTRIANKFYYYRGDGGYWVDYSSIPCPT